MVKGMKTCGICGRDFPLLFEEHYVVEDPQKVGAFANLVSTDKAYEYDAIDCPHCGCQNVLQPRKPAVTPCAKCACGECEEDEEHDE